MIVISRHLFIIAYSFFCEHWKPTLASRFSSVCVIMCNCLVCALCLPSSFFLPCVLCVCASLVQSPKPVITHHQLITKILALPSFILLLLYHVLRCGGWLLFVVDADVAATIISFLLAWYNHNNNNTAVVSRVLSPEFKQNNKNQHFIEIRKIDNILIT